MGFKSVCILRSLALFVLLATGALALGRDAGAEYDLNNPQMRQNVGASHGGMQVDSHHPSADGKGEGGHAKHAAAPELPTMFHVLNSIKLGDGRTFGDTHLGHFIHTFEKQLFLILVTTLMGLAIWGTLRMRALRPGRLQTFVEIVVETLMNFFTGILGREHLKHVPFFATLFIFIWVHNLTAAVPMFGPATAKYQTTVALAILVFGYVQFFAIKEGGLKHYLWHLAGSPKDKIGWAITPLMVPLEIIGTLAKPLSLSLRLFGNIMGEDILLGVFLLLGISLMGAFWPDPLIGVPLHFPFLFMVLLTSTIQALVFSLLGSIYLAMVLPHHDHEHEHEPHDASEDSHDLFPGAELENERSGHVDTGAAPFVG